MAETRQPIFVPDSEILREQEEFLASRKVELQFIYPGAPIEPIKEPGRYAFSGPLEDTTTFQHIVSLVMSNPKTRGTFLDTLSLFYAGSNIEKGIVLNTRTTEETGENTTSQIPIQQIRFNIPVTFFTFEYGVGADVSGFPITLQIAESLGDRWPEFKTQIDESNESWEITPSESLLEAFEEIRKRRSAGESGYDTGISTSANVPSPDTIPTLPIAIQANDYSILCSEEVDALIQSAGHGKSGLHWKNGITSEGKEARIFKRRGDTHSVQILRSQELDEEPAEWGRLEKLTSAQNSDFALALYYIAGVLAPPAIADHQVIIGGWIDLNDVMEKIGWMAEKPNAARREVLRGQIWDFLKYGANARVTGERSVPYLNKDTGKIIPTKIESPVWSITDVRRPEQEGLFDEASLVVSPVMARLVISEQWEPLFRHPSLSQYFPMGEVVGSIPPQKISGDWARVMLLRLMREWRIRPHKALKGEIQLTRREVLNYYLPKTKSIDDLLNDPHNKNPRRVIDYYLGATQYMVETDLVSATGDASKKMTVARMLEEYKGYGAVSRWADGPANFSLGGLSRSAVEKFTANIYETKPRDLRAVTRKKAGRPRKGETS